MRTYQSTNYQNKVQEHPYDYFPPPRSPTDSWNHPQEKNQHSPLIKSRPYSVQENGSDREREYYVRVPLENLDQELQIYEWRMKRSCGFVPINSYKVISEGNIFSPHAIIKIKLDGSLKTPSNSQQVSLSSTLALLHEIIPTTHKLIQRFGCFEFTQENIIFTEERAQIWPLEKFWLNPTNPLIRSQLTQCSERKTLLTLLQILQERCLRTSLKGTFFHEMKKSKNLFELMQKIQLFQNEHSLYSPNKLKSSTSTSYPQSVNLSFSGKLSRKKSKKFSVNVRQNLGMFPFRSLQALCAGSEEDEESGVYFSQKNLSSYDAKKQQQLSIISMSNLQISDRKPPQESIVISQTFKDEQETQSPLSITHKGYQRRRGSQKQQSESNPFNILNIQIHPRIPQLESSHEMSIKIDSSVMEKSKSQMVQSQIVDDDSYLDPYEIIRRNGWASKVVGLTDTPTRQSYCDGREEKSSYLRGLELNLLKSVGRDVCNSFLPVEQELGHECQ